MEAVGCRISRCAFSPASVRRALRRDHQALNDAQTLRTDPVYQIALQFQQQFARSRYQAFDLTDLDCNAADLSSARHMPTVKATANAKNSGTNEPRSAVDGNSGFHGKSPVQIATIFELGGLESDQMIANWIHRVD